MSAEHSAFTRSEHRLALTTAQEIQRHGSDQILPAAIDQLVDFLEALAQQLADEERTAILSQLPSYEEHAEHLKDY